MQQLQWEQCKNQHDIEELLHLVEPYPQEFNAIMKCLGNHPGLYDVSVVWYDSRIVALCIATFLPKTKTVHIEDFALHPIIRGQGYAQILWDGWLKYYNISENQALTVEVYAQNIKIWSKIMKIKDLGVEDAHIMLVPKAPMRFMGKNLSVNPKLVYEEWFAIQRFIQSKL